MASKGWYGRKRQSATFSPTLTLKRPRSSRAIIANEDAQKQKAREAIKREIVDAFLKGALWKSLDVVSVIPLIFVYGSA